METETKIINEEQDSLYTTEQNQQLRGLNFLAVGSHTYI
jgi:hypothetical protein